LTIYHKGEIVLVPFPFTNGTQKVERPALIIATLPYEDLIMVQITKQSQHPYSILIDPTDFLHGNLKYASYVRPERIFVPNENIVIRKIAVLSYEKMQEIIQAIIDLISAEETPSEPINESPEV
jgi:mRNA interferase MazF